MVKETKITELVGSYINEYERIIIVANSCGNYLCEQFFKYLSMARLEKNTLILTSQNLVCENAKVTVSKVHSEQLDAIEKLYLTYQFSSKVRLLNHSKNYGSLFNLVDSAVINLEDAFKSIIE